MNSKGLPSINPDLCKNKKKRNKWLEKGWPCECALPPTIRTQLGGALLEISVSFAASFALETLLCVITSATDSWEPVAPGARHHQTSNFHLASQNDPGSYVPQGKGSVGVCWGRFGQGVHGASDGCFWPAVLATCKLFTPQTHRFCGLRSSQEHTHLSWRQKEEGGWLATENSKWKRQL